MKKSGLLFIEFGSLILVFCLAFSSLPAAQAEIANPEEALFFLQEMARKSADYDYWGIWSNQDCFSGKKDFYEVVYLRYIGLAWRNLNEENLVAVKKGQYRYVVDLSSGEVKGIYPLYDLPFLPPEEDNLELLLENYLLDLQDSTGRVLSRYTGNVVRSFSVDEKGLLNSQAFYTPDGKLKEEGSFIYRDYSPDYTQLVKYVEAMKKPSDVTLPSLTVSGKKLFQPSLLPPGFQLKQVYLVKNQDRNWYQLVYTDGLQYFSLWQSVYPLRLPEEKGNNKPSLRKEGDIVTVMGEKGGFYLALMGNFDLKMITQIFNSITWEGGN
ncbi:MAG: hypothetical protein KBH15_00700 [Candidatus Atribacteria bacterium]|nr:hypothetical protein [Candidatus Atribacteria bacterium]